MDNIWRDKKLALQVKLRLYDSIVKTILLYCAETWPMSQANCKWLKAAHHRCLRRILNISWQDKVRNESVRELTRQDQLLTKVREHRLRWWGHVQRLEGGRRAKQALNWIQEGSRKIGRPRITWNDNIRKDIESSGVTWEEALLLMTDRNEWRSWIAQRARHGMDLGLTSKVRIFQTQPTNQTAQFLLDLWPSSWIWGKSWDDPVAFFK